MHVYVQTTSFSAPATVIRNGQVWRVLQRLLSYLKGVLTFICSCGHYCLTQRSNRNSLYIKVVNLIDSTQRNLDKVNNLISKLQIYQYKQGEIPLSHKNHHKQRRKKMIQQVHNTILEVLKLKNVNVIIYTQ